MKRLNFLLLSLPFLFFSCLEDAGDENPKGDGEYSFYITGFREYLTYEFTSGQGRVETTPDDVKNLTVIITSEDGTVVYEKRYYNYDYWYPTDAIYYPEGDTMENQHIPDTIFIPLLPAGVYTIAAVTADFYYDRYYYENGSNSSDFILYPYVQSPGPIYAGFQVIELIEDDQEVLFEMKNISAKVRVKLKDGQEIVDGHLGFSFETMNGKIFNIRTGEFDTHNQDYYNYFYTSLGSFYYWNGLEEIIDNVTENSVYIMPQTIKHLRIDYWDNFGGVSIYQEIDIDPDLELNVGDAITFTLDLEALIGNSGSSPGIFEWEDITWNELEEITIP